MTRRSAAKKVATKKDNTKKSKVSLANMRTICRMVKQKYAVPAIVNATKLPRTTVYRCKQEATKMFATKAAEQQLRRAIKESGRKLKKKKINRERGAYRHISGREISAYLTKHRVGLKLTKKQLPGKTKLALLLREIFPREGSATRASRLKRRVKMFPNNALDRAGFLSLQRCAAICGF